MNETKTAPITAECGKAEDSDGYLVGCEHEEHSLEHCAIDSCLGFIVDGRWYEWMESVEASNLRSGTCPPLYICTICKDCGYSWDKETCTIAQA